MGTPTSTGLQVPVGNEVNDDSNSRSSSAVTDRAYLNYARSLRPNDSAEKNQSFPSAKLKGFQWREVALRSKPISIATVQNGSGKPVYRVTGTLFPGGKQQKLITPDYQEAEAQRQAWEDIRLRAGSANRPKQMCVLPNHGHIFAVNWVTLFG